MKDKIVMVNERPYKAHDLAVGKFGAKGLVAYSSSHPEFELGEYEDFEIRNFIDGKRSILEIRNAVSAEFRPVPLTDVENYIKVLEIGGMVTIEKRI